MDDNIDIQIITQKKEVKGAAIQGSSLISTFEEVRNLMQSGQPIFINGNEYLTHATKPSSSWPSGCIELSRDYQHGSDYSATIEFEIYSKPKVKKEKKKAEVIDTNQKPNDLIKEKVKPISASKGKKGHTPRLEEQAKKSDADGNVRKGKAEAASMVSTTVVAGTATVAISDESKVAPAKNQESRQIQSGKRNAKKAADQSKKLEEVHEKAIPAAAKKETKLNPGNAKETKQGSQQEKDTKDSDALDTNAKEIVATRNEQTEDVSTDAATLQPSQDQDSSEDKVQQARLLAIQRTKARKQQMEEKAKQEKEREDQIRKDKEEHAAHMRVKLQNKALERLKDYEEIKRQEDIDKQEEHFSSLEKQQAAEELIQTEEYQKKVKQLRIDAKKRLKKYQQLEEERKLEEEESRKVALHQHTNRIRAPLPTGSTTGTSFYTLENATQYDENSMAGHSLLTIPPNFDMSGMNGSIRSNANKHNGNGNSTSHVIYEEGEEEDVDMENEDDIMEEDSFYMPQQLPRVSLPIRHDPPNKHTSSAASASAAAVNRKETFQPTRSSHNEERSSSQKKKKHPIIVEDEVEDEMDEDLGIDTNTNTSPSSFMSSSKSKSHSHSHSHSQSNHSTPLSGKDGYGYGYGGSPLPLVVSMSTPIVAFIPEEHLSSTSVSGNGNSSNKHAHLFHKSPHAIQATTHHTHSTHTHSHSTHSAHDGDSIGANGIGGTGDSSDSDESNEDIHDEDSLLLLYHPDHATMSKTMSNTLSNNMSKHVQQTTPLPLPLRMESSRPGSADEESVIEMVEASDKLNNKKRLNKHSDTNTNTKTNMHGHENDSSSLSSSEEDEDYHYQTPVPAKPPAMKTRQTKPKGGHTGHSSGHTGHTGHGVYENTGMSDLSDVDNEPSSPYIKHGKVPVPAPAQHTGILPPIKAASHTGMNTITNTGTLNRSVKKKYAMEMVAMATTTPSSAIASVAMATIITTGLAPQATIQSFKQIGSQHQQQQNQQYSPVEEGSGSSGGGGGGGGGGKAQASYDMNEAAAAAVIKKKRKPFRKLPPIPIAPYSQIPVQMN